MHAKFWSQILITFEIMLDQMEVRVVIFCIHNCENQFLQIFFNANNFINYKSIRLQFALLLNSYLENL